MTKDERRAAMPECSAFIDDMRETFGPLTAINATENGHTVLWGNPIESDEGCVAEPLEVAA